jgi:hypothetical protein
MLYPAAPSTPLGGLREQQAAGRGTPTPCGVSWVASNATFAQAGFGRLGLFSGGGLQVHADSLRSELTLRKSARHPAYPIEMMGFFTGETHAEQ